MSPKERPTAPIAIYARVSRVMGRDVEAEGGTAEQQEARCRAALESKGLIGADEPFVDLDVSGGKQSRPAWDRVVEGIEEGTLGGVIALNLSRLGRHLRVEEVILGLEDKGATVILVEDNLDTSTASGRMFLGIMARFNAYYRENTGAGWHATLDRNAADGSYHGRAPAGYSKDDGGRLVPNEHAAAIREVFRLKVEEGASWGTLARYLTEARVPTQSGNAWSATATRNLVKNVAYTGVLRIGDRVRADAHEALVDDDTFRRANRVGRRDVGKRTDGRLLGDGIIRCGVCGKAMTYGQTKQPNGRTYSFLRCSGTGTKGHPTIQTGIVEPFIANALTEYVVVLQKDAPLIAVDPEVAQRLDDARAELETLEQELADGDISASIFAKAATKVEADIEALEREVANPTAKPTAFVSRAAREREEVLYHLEQVAGWNVDPDYEPAPGVVVRARRFIAETLGQIVIQPGRGAAEKRVQFVTFPDAAENVVSITTVPEEQA